MARKKLNTEIESIRGRTVTGTFLGMRPLLNRKTGEVLHSRQYGTPLFVLEMNDDKGEVNTYWADAGLRGSLIMADVKDGMKIEIVHKGERDTTITNEDTGKEVGVTLQTYDIFELT